MNSFSPVERVYLGLTAAFLFVGAAFLLELWGHRPDTSPIALVDPEFIDPAPVRLSAAELYRTDGDTSGFSCYACHDEGQRVQLTYDSNGFVVVPEDHDDIVLAHGRNQRNNDCFNCHDPDQMDHLRTRSGQRLPFEKSNLLCASCHGPTYRDWEAGIHGRTSGFWNRRLGESVRLDCTSCHDPHAPAFPALAPAPGPVHLHERDRVRQTSHPHGN